MGSAVFNNTVHSLISDGRQSTVAQFIQRGIMRYLRSAHDMCCYTEVPLGNNRRADIVAISSKGEIWIVEIKSSAVDLRTDTKWSDYKEYCDKFFFCKPHELAGEIFPYTEGLMVADGYSGDVIRAATENRMSAPRRKAMLLKLSRLGADRVHKLLDPSFTLS